MKNKHVVLGMAAFALAGFTAAACEVEGVVSCPNGATAAGIKVYIIGGGAVYTDAQGVYQLAAPASSGQFSICVDTTTLPAGFTIKKPCATFTASALDIAVVSFTLDGPLCAVTPPQGPCWLTGGGTIGKIQGQPAFSYGGVVNPGCSPIAAGGGNFNVLSHDGHHFKGLLIQVVGCSGVPTGSPPVNVNIIDFVGTGTLDGTDVQFQARAIDAADSGAGKDALYLNVTDFASPPNVLMLISAGPGVSPVTVSTGNLQIHTSSCP